MKDSNIIRRTLGPQWCRPVRRVRIHLNEAWYQEQRDRWKRKAKDVCRVLRLMADRPRRMILNPNCVRSATRPSCSWGDAVAFCTAQLCQHRSSTRANPWSKAAHRIAGNMKTRKGYPLDRTTIKAKDILALLHRQGFRCAYTGDPLTPDSLSADHAVPVQRGGGHDVGNIKLTTKEVNAAKGTMTLDEFVSLCARVVRHLGALAPEPAPPSPDAASADACEVLARLGFVDAAEEVRALRVKVKTMEAQALKGGRSLDEREAKRLAKIAELNTDIQRLQVQRSTLRRTTGPAANGD